MRVAVVFIPQSRRDKLLEISKALARGIEAQGHHVDVIDGSRDVSAKLTIYEYLAIGTEIISTFGGKIPTAVAEYLKASGIVGGKRSFAFVLKRPFGTDRGVQRLMKVMEGEGMFLRFSNVMTSAAEAEYIGKRLKIG